MFSWDGGHVIVWLIVGLFVCLIVCLLCVNSACCVQHASVADEKSRYLKETNFNKDAVLRKVSWEFDVKSSSSSWGFNPLYLPSS